jgi:hypothetical protein
MADDSLDWADFHKRFALALTAFELPLLGEDESAAKLVLSLSHQDCLVFTVGAFSFVVTPCFQNGFRIRINGIDLSRANDLNHLHSFMLDVRSALELEVEIVCDTLPPKEKIPNFVLSKPTEKEDGYEL